MRLFDLSCLSFFCFLLSGLATAQIYTPENSELKFIDSLSIKNQEGIYLEFPDLGVEDALPLDRLAKDVIELVGHAPDRLSLMLTKDLPGNSIYSHIYDQIRTGFNKDRPDSLKHVYAVFLHEMGHGSFQAYLESEIAFINGLYQARTKDNENHLIVDELLVASQVDELEGGHDSVMTLMKRFDEEKVGQAFETNFAEDWYDRTPRANDFFSISVPYHELFADIVTSVVMDNPDSIHHALEYLYPDGDHSCRSMLFGQANFRDEEAPHCTLSATRAHLWNNIISPQMAKGSAEVAVRRIMSFFAQEVDYFFQRKVSNGRDFDVELAISRISNFK